MNNTTTHSITVDLSALESEERKVYTATTILICLLSFIGIVGNGHILFVYSVMKKSNPRIFILTLGGLDLLTCTTSMPFVVVNSQMPYTFNNSPACKVLSAFSYFTTVSAGFVLLMIAIDRYRKVCRPLARQISKNEAKVMCVASMGIALLLVWPSPVLYGINELVLRDDVIATECKVLVKYIGVLTLTFNGVLLLTSLIGFVSLVVLYSLTRRTIVEHDKYRKTFEMQLHRRRTIPELVVDIFRGKKKPSITVSTHCLQKEPSVCTNNKRRDLSYAMSSNSTPTPADSANSRHMDILHATSNLSPSVTIKSKHTERPFSVSSYTSPAQFKSMDIKHAERSFSVSTYKSVTTSSMTDLLYSARLESFCPIGGMPRSETSRSLPNLLDLDSDNTMPRKDERSLSLTMSLEIISAKRINKLNTIKDVDKSVRRSFDNINTSLKNHKSSTETRLHLRNKRTTLMFAWITVIFVLTFVSHQALRLAAIADPSLIDGMTFSGKVTYYFFLWCVFINNMSNWIVYGCLDNDFRIRMKRMYRNLFTYLRGTGT